MHKFCGDFLGTLPVPVWGICGESVRTVSDSLGQYHASRKPLWRQEKPVFSRGNRILIKFNKFVNNNPVIARLCAVLWVTCGVVPKTGKGHPCRVAFCYSVSRARGSRSDVGPVHPQSGQSQRPSSVVSNSNVPQIGQQRLISYMVNIPFS